VSEHELELVIARLLQEVEQRGAGHTEDAPAAAASLPGRAEAGRVWAIQPGEPLGGKTSSLHGIRRTVSAAAKRWTRKLIRWYVQPALVDQRRFNEATLAMIDDLGRRVAALEARASEAGERPE
jgi:hypothetical protein